MQRPPVRHYGAEPQPSPGGTELNSSHCASGFLPNECHGSAPTAALVSNQTTDHVQAGDPYFQGKVLSDPPYLHEQLLDHQVARALRSTTAPLFYRPTVSTIFASWAFFYSAPQVWNCLGTSTRSVNIFSSFRHCLKS